MKSKELSSSSYVTPNNYIADCRQMIRSLEDIIRNTNDGVIVPIDFKARSVDLEIPPTNLTERYILGVVANMELCMLTWPTYLRFFA